MEDFLQQILFHSRMFGFLNLLFAFFSQVIRIIENYRTEKNRKLDQKRNAKADAYDHLQKALRARNTARRSNAADKLMSDDGYQRKQ